MKKYLSIFFVLSSVLFSSQEQRIMSGKCINKNLTQEQKVKIKDSLTALINTEKSKTINMYRKHLEKGFIKQEEYDKRVKLREEIAMNKSGIIQNAPMNCTTDFSGPEEKDVYWYHYDHLGSVTHITGRDGEVVQNMEYFPSGEVFVENHLNSPNSPYKFNAKELDDETGYYYYGARYLNPRTSLWLNVDPLAGYDPIMNTEHYIDGQHNGGVYKSGNLNPYIYTYQNPIIYVDPNGKQVKISGPHPHNDGTKFEVWEVNVKTKVITYNARSGRYEDRSVSNRTEYRMRSNSPKINRFYGNETEYLITNKDGKFSTISTQTEKRVDVPGLISKMYNPVDVDAVESTRKAGNMMNDWGDKISKGGIVFGGVPSLIGTGVGFIGTGLEMTADYQEGKYNSMGTKGTVYLNSEILGVAGDVAIDGSIKNPVAKKAAKLLYQQSVKMGGDAINNKADKKQK